MPYVLKWGDKLLLRRSVLVAQVAVAITSGLKVLILLKDYVGFGPSWCNRAEVLGLRSEQVKIILMKC